MRSHKSKRMAADEVITGFHQSEQINAQSDIFQSLIVFLALSYQASILVFDNSDLVRASTIAAYSIFSIFVLFKINYKVTYLSAFLFASVFLLSAYSLLSADPLNDINKLNRVFFTFAIFGILPAAIFLHPKTVDRVPIAMIVWAVIVFGVLVASSSTFNISSSRRIIGDNNPIWIARCLALGAISASYLFLASNKHRKLYFGALVICILGINLTGSRGPLLGYAAGLTFLLVRNLTIKASTKFIVVALIILLGIFFVFGLGLETQSRVTNMNFEDDARHDIWLFALDEIYLYPDGIGVGQFYWRGLTWPHNIFLEFVCEWGWYLGGTMVALVLGGSFVLLLSDHNNFVKSLLLMELVNASLSGDVGSPRFLYSLVFVGFLYSLGVRQRTKNQLISRLNRA
jgi:hypothetical protein